MSDDGSGSRPMRHVGESLGEVAKGLGLDSPSAFAAVSRCWEETVGPQFAAHARPRSLRHGVLTVVVDAPAWATSLAFLEGEVLARLETAAGPGTVRSLRAVVDPRRPGR